LGFTGLYKVFGFDCCGECSTKCKPLTKVSGFSFYVMQLMLEYGELGTRTAAEPTATTTSAASGGSSEELLGPRPAIRKQGAADAGCRNPSACGGNREARLGQRSDFSRPRQGVAEKSASATRKVRRFTSCRAKTAAARKAPCGGCSHFVESSGKITLRTRRCTRSRTLPAAS
jgi:hypothetical protein